MSASDEPEPALDRELALVLTGQLLLAGALAYRQVDLLDPDGVATLQLAAHWAAGRVDLAISGTWGPLVGLLLAPALALGLPPLAAGRALLVLASLAFTLAGARLLRSLDLGVRTRRVLTAALALFAVTFASSYLTGDLPLAAALTALATLGASEVAGRQAPLRAVAGLSLVATLAKPAGLPLALLVVLAAAALSEASGRARRAALLAAATLAGGAPWLLVQSLHHGAPTLSRAGAVNHALLGPALAGPDMQVNAIRGHPTFSRLHAPRRGRITSWEDPAELPYPSWNPLGSLRRVDLVGLALLVTLVTGARGAARRRDVDDRRAAFLLAVVLAVVGLYLPFFVHWRYLWPAFPPLLGSLGLLVRGARSPEGRESPAAPPKGESPRRCTSQAPAAPIADRHPLPPLHGHGAGSAPARAGAGSVGRRPTSASTEEGQLGKTLLAGAALTLPLLAAGLLTLGYALAGPFPQAAHARQLAALVGDPPGPVATWPGADDPGDNAMGLYLAWTLGVPWLGPAPPGPAGPSAAKDAGARVLLLQRPWGERGPPPPREAPPGWIRRGEVHVEDWVNGRPGSWSYRILVLESP